MKIDYANILVGVAVTAVAAGCYFLGRVHEDYLNEKREQAEAEEPVEPVVEEPGNTQDM